MTTFCQLLDSDAVSTQAAHSALACRTGDIGDTKANFGVWARSMTRKQTLWNATAIQGTLYYLAIARCRWLVLNISNKYSHLSESNPKVGPKSSNKKKRQEKANLTKGGPKRASKKEGDQLIKKFICEETYDTSHSQNCLSPRPPSSP